MRKIINGDPNAPLHASEMERTDDNFAALSKFFLDRSFFRIAVTTTKAIGLPSGMHPCAAVIGQLNEETAAVAALPGTKRVWIIIESSQRADPVVKNCFGQLVSLNAPQLVPVEHCLMPKSSHEAGLEVADFIISAAGNQVRRRLRGQQGSALDFIDVFCRLPAEGCLYREVTEVAVHDGGLVSVTGVRLGAAAALALDPDDGSGETRQANVSRR